jgi:hypothetical protein
VAAPHVTLLWGRVGTVPALPMHVGYGHKRELWETSAPCTAEALPN